MELRSNLRRHDGDVRSVGKQPRKLPGSDPSSSNEENTPTAQFQKDGIHGTTLSYAVTPCGETTRSKSDNARPILTGCSTRSAMTSVVL